ncbi:unnamed protein product (macronuclear) [Paramecium tetraurelia]|uniref:Chromosome undetermined scaffold_1, whole genome shotgun sequence n=1 Tax=Paramecium tetraurelia TaxID=5888 RepID=Q6BFD4_PARTE|nr:hypothetical protein [Paramecium tetraurelia strain d4-2]XP_001422993.1 uncharacterized protein GSPATT00000030001 [Paramecium tetraurelia]CAH03637.1 hypothetical protein PTMB.436 [Paramecium tetraurelia]CAK55595.1 unnamed protein product [Paramecium tetraurelia]|eukprot:XP_001422993.1 hypothetical protein (macronuclear) [Paramecium tetraurelia strain d4-2]
MLLWLNGMTNPSIKHPMETMMDEYHANPSNIIPLLAEDEFFIQAKNLNLKVIDFIRQHQKSIAEQLLYLIVQQIDEVTEKNHDNVVIFPILSIEFFELDLIPLTQMILQETAIKTLFEGLHKTPDQIHEPQWSNIQRLFALLLSKEPKQVCQTIFKFDLLKLFLNHLESATVNSILIQLFNPENGNYEDAKLEVLELGFRGFNVMEEMSVLNFTYLIHEIMTRYFSSDLCHKLVQFIVSKQIILQMFKCLRENHDKLFLSKSSAHILSLISNYYSLQMQNINIYEENIPKKIIEENSEIAYHQKLTLDFEKTDFMNTFTQEMNLFVESFNQVLENDNKRLRTLRLKLLEIFDNLTRISNITLWKQMNQLKLFNQIVQIYFKYKNSDIFHSIFEKLLLYILNRAISDFHPYWCTILIEDINIYTLISEKITMKTPIPGYIYLLANHLTWFQKELNDKLIIDGPLAKYYQQLKHIEEVILLNDQWRRVSPIFNITFQKNTVKLGSSQPGSASNIPVSSEPIIHYGNEQHLNNSNAQCLFNKVKNNQTNIASISGDEPPEFESPDKYEERVQNPQVDEYQYEPRKSPEKLNVQESPKKDEFVKVPSDPSQTQIPQTQEQRKETDYKFVEGVYLQSTLPTKPQQADQQDVQNPSAPVFSNWQEVTPERNHNDKKIDMMSISLQDFVKPMDRFKFSSGGKMDQEQNEKLISPNKKVQDIIKKYSNMSKSVTFGQANMGNTKQTDNLSLIRKKSMESSLRLKQLDQVQNEEFKILKTNKQDSKILTSDNKRILMVDELDKDQDVSSLRNSLVNLSNISFSSTSSKKRTIKFKKPKQAQSNGQEKDLNRSIPEELQTNKNIVFSLQSSNSLRDSFVSSQSSITEEKKFRQANKKDIKFLNYIRNIK